MDAASTHAAQQHELDTNRVARSRSSSTTLNRWWRSRPALRGALLRRLGLDEAALAQVLGETCPQLRPASLALTHKGRFATGFKQFQTETVRLAGHLPPGQQTPGSAAPAPDESDQATSSGGAAGSTPAQPGEVEQRPAGVWFLKNVAEGLSRGVSVHPSRAAAEAAAEAARRAPVSWYHGETRAAVAGAEYVVQAAVPAPWLWGGRKTHFRLYLLAVSPPEPAGAARLRAALRCGRATPAAAPGSGGDQPALETRWYLSEHVWLSAAPAPWSARSTERSVQLSIHRSVELRESGDGNHAVLWPVWLFHSY
eukprot:SAG11_NODE_1136_length_5731_cov_23.656250_6_plen_311_part_00